MRVLNCVAHLEDGLREAPWGRSKATPPGKTDVRGVEARARDTLVELHELSRSQKPREMVSARRRPLYA